ncbi:MAG: hypothetical protein KGL43_26585, partial [Burkholderiales bacterium]|nr:hypothetical protein [Burkholderiales bacterium]
PPPAASKPEPATAASTPTRAASAPVHAAPPPPVEEPSFLSSLLDNPLVLPGAGVLVALLAGLGMYRLRRRVRKQGGETSFLESRLQPDSFFGASGGQRIDTREGSGASSMSSMSYSLSQLDAIGDVDPVAEADVYLAYGRDLQAEEILKEAMRSNPERMAIRLKLLEVYVKRRDLKGFELLATQVYTLTGGSGEDWEKAQELGRQLDPDNPLYQAGGKPNLQMGPGGKPIEPLGAETMPHTAKQTVPPFVPAADATLSGGLDLDLDLGPSHSAPLHPAERTQPIPPHPVPAEEPVAVPNSMRTVAMPVAEPEPAHDSQMGALDFDLGDLGNDGAEPASVLPPVAADSSLDFGDFKIEGHDHDTATPSTLDDDDADPLARKLELAEEFRQIGDMEGARDLLEEVVAKAEGTLKSKAQGMLSSLG